MWLRDDGLCAYSEDQQEALQSTRRSVLLKQGSRRVGGEPQPVQGSHVHPTPPSWESLCVIKGHSLWYWGAYAKDMKTEESDWECDQDESPFASFTDASGPQMLHDGLFLLHRPSLQTSFYTPRPPHYRVFFCICPLFNVTQSFDEFQDKPVLLCKKKKINVNSEE